jgi:hypothetical protein
VTDPVEYNDHNKNEKNPRGSSSSPSSSWSYETDVRTYTRQLGKLKRERKYSEFVFAFYHILFSTFGYHITIIT